MLYSQHGDWHQRASGRLAFRELGLAIGPSAMNMLQKECTMTAGEALSISSNSGAAFYAFRQVSGYLTSAGPGS